MINNELHIHVINEKVHKVLIKNSTIVLFLYRYVLKVINHYFLFIVLILVGWTMNKTDLPFFTKKSFYFKSLPHFSLILDYYFMSTLSFNHEKIYKIFD